MPKTLDDLIQDLHFCFAALYQQSTGSAETAEVAYEPIGRSVAPDAFRLQPGDTAFSQPITMEVFSRLTNVLPDVTNGNFQYDTGRTIDKIYGDLLAPSLPSAGAHVDAFAKIKEVAGRAMVSIPSLTGPYPFHPAFASPRDWYNACVQTNWRSYDSAASTGPPPAAAGETPLPPARRWNWVMLPKTQRSKAVAAPPRLGTPASPPLRFPLPYRTRSVAASAEPAGSVAVMDAQPAMVAQRSFRQRMLLSGVSLAGASSQPVTSSSLSIAFDYALVSIERPWLSQAFLSARQWYVPGARAGDYSAGLADDNTGTFAYLPTAFIAVKSLCISGFATDQDKTAMSVSDGLGFFSLAQSTHDSASIIAPGIQIVAWVCEPMPLLPPDSDPAL